MLKDNPTFSAIRTPSSYPASQKRYLRGSRADLRVPYREITLSATKHRDRTEENSPLPVCDTSGSYTDPEVHIELTRGLPVPRADWIKQRDDSDIVWQSHFRVRLSPAKRSPKFPRAAFLLRSSYCSTQRTSRTQ
jgi:ThiC-associated domain